jgi:hypothetical protein
MRLINTNPIGAVYLPLIGRVLEPGEEFTVDDETGNALLEQIVNYAPAPKPTKGTPTTAQEG